MAATAQNVEKHAVFVWEGSDKHGKRVKGESRAASLALVRADLRRQGINPLKVKKKSTSFLTNRRRHRRIQSPTCHDDAGWCTPCSSI
jgi:type IV pilus assembly protein PilC